MHCITAGRGIASSRRIFFRRNRSHQQLTTYAWGNADYGQLGLPTSQLTDEVDTFGLMSPHPQRIPALGGKPPISVSISSSHTAFVRPDGSLLTCGLGHDGQLGLGDTDDRAEPTLVQSLPPISSVACGSRHTLALTRDGLVFAFGNNKHGQLGLSHLPPNENSKHAKANLNGAKLPHLVTRLAEDGRRIVKIAAGDYFSVALSDTGRVFTWGAGDCGVLGHRPLPPLSALAAFVLQSTGAGHEHPRLVRELADKKIVSVACGRRHVVAVDDHGRAFAWGSGRHFLLGTEREDDESEPVRAFTALPPVKKIAIGSTHALVLTCHGTVFAVGENEHGCLGIGSASPFDVSAVPVLLEEASPAVDVAAGWHVSAAVMRDGAVRTWGSASAGALGVEGLRDWTVPRDIGLKARCVIMSCGGASVVATA